MTLLLRMHNRYSGFDYYSFVGVHPSLASRLGLLILTPPTVQGERPMCGSTSFTGNDINLSANGYIRFSANKDADILVPLGVTKLRGMVVNYSTGGGTGTMVLTVYDNGVSQSPTINVPCATDGSGTSAPSLTVAAGDLITLKATTGCTGTAPTVVYATLSFTAY